MKAIYWINGPWPGRVAIVARPRGDDWLADEIKLWRRNGIVIVVSLLTQSESAELGLAQEAVICSQQGIACLSFPIPDRATPSSLVSMKELTENLVTSLASGKNLAIHCRQGIGRSGLLAASLLVKTGMPVDQAFCVIEDGRGVAVPDTLEQRQWVEKFARFIADPLLF